MTTPTSNSTAKWWMFCIGETLHFEQGTFEDFSDINGVNEVDGPFATEAAARNFYGAAA